MNITELENVPAFPNEAMSSEKAYIESYTKATSRGASTYLPYAEILKAIAIGARVEYQAGDGTWSYQHPSHTLLWIAGIVLAPDKFRIALDQDATTNH